MPLIKSSSKKALQKNIETEMKERADDRRDVYLEAKGNGFDVKVLRKVIAMRKKDPDERATEDAVLETYLHALDMLNG